MNTQRVEGHTPKDCPFCGVTPELRPNNAAIDSFDAESYVHHSHNGPCCILGNMDFSLADWNRRASIERLEKVNEALVRALDEACGDLDGLLDAVEQMKGAKTDALRRALALYREAARLAKEPA